MQEWLNHLLIFIDFRCPTCSRHLDAAWVSILFNGWTPVSILAISPCDKCCRVGSDNRIDLICDSPPSCHLKVLGRVEVFTWGTSCDTETSIPKDTGQWSCRQVPNKIMDMKIATVAALCYRRGHNLLNCFHYMYDMLISLSCPATRLAKVITTI